MLEELDIDYKLKLYHRLENGHADPELAKVHPLGKSPVITVDYHDGAKPHVVAESGYIISYLTKNFDPKAMLKPANDKDQGEVDFYLHYAEGTVQPYLTSYVHHDLALANPSLTEDVSKYVEGFHANYTNVELKKHLDWLESNLKEKKGDFLVGEKLSGADIIFHFVIFLAFKLDRCKSWVTPESYPTLKQWLDKIESRPKFKSAEKRVETEGNGEYAIAF